MKKILLALLGFWGWTAASTAQSIPVGHWQSFLSYFNAVSATDAGDRAFVATKLGVVEFVGDYEIYFHNKITSGLSEANIRTIRYNHPYKALIIGYNSGNIDVFYHETHTVVNLPAISSNPNILGVKNINHIFCDSNKVYFACSFGLVQLDMGLMEFSQTTFTGSNEAMACTRYGNALFLATKRGIYKGVLDGRNLQDFAAWQAQGTAHNLPLNTYVSSAILAANNRVYASVNDTLFQYDDAQGWRHIPVINTEAGNVAQSYCYDGYPLTILNPSFANDRIILVTGRNVFYDLQFDNHELHKNFLTVGNLVDVASSDKGSQWLASDLYGIVRWNYLGVNPVNINSKITDQTSALSVDNQGSLWVTNDPFDGQYYSFSDIGFSRWNGSDWKNIDGGTVIPNGFTQSSTLANNTRKRETFVGSYMAGILHYKGDSLIAHYNQYNTTNGLQGTQGDTQRTRIGGMVFNSEGDCWIANALAPRPYVLRKANGTWYNFPSAYSGLFMDIAIDRNGFKWGALKSGNITVFSEGDLANDGDNREMMLTTGNSNLASSDVNCVVADREGVIWVGTGDGVTIFSCSSDMFTSGCAGSRPVVNPDNFNGHLLEGENVKTIAIDGGNRKWIGTDNGVFVLSPDGYERVHYFNIENSPLLDNSVNKIAIDGTTGMVYISTESGLCGYKGEATAGRLPADADAAYAYPNPVRHDYTGLIAIKNLPTDANVKITDISGKLVYEAYSLGGQVTWDGHDYTGRKANTGVYLVFTITADGENKLATKLLFIN